MVTLRIVGVIVAVILNTVTSEAPKCETIFGYIVKDDCTGYYLCVWGIPFEMPSCATGLVFSSSILTCVESYSYWDDCPLHGTTMPTTVTTTQGSLTIEEQCKLSGNGTILPHPTECQLYYNCSMTYSYIPRYFEQHLVECRYPDLFSTITSKCENFENVECGDRNEPKSGCNYRALQCPVAHCRPCSLDYPSCEGNADGIHPHSYKLWSPFYINCSRERFMSQETCPVDEEGRTQLFSPETNNCTSLDFIPQEHGGLMNNCTGKEDGKNADDFDRCDRYTECEDEEVVNVVKCPTGKHFDSAQRSCVLMQDACLPCGPKTDCQK